MLPLASLPSVRFASLPCLLRFVPLVALGVGLLGLLCVSLSTVSLSLACFAPQGADGVFFASSAPSPSASCFALLTSFSRSRVVLSRFFSFAQSSWCLSLVLQTTRFKPCEFACARRRRRRPALTRSVCFSQVFFNGSNNKL